MFIVARRNLREVESNTQKRSGNATAQNEIFFEMYKTIVVPIRLREGEFDDTDAKL